MPLDLTMPRPARLGAQPLQARAPKRRAAERAPEAAGGVLVVDRRDVDYLTYPAVDPMLLVFRERVATFRMLVQWVRRAFAPPKRRPGPRA